MLLIVIALLLVAGIAYYQVVQGLFSAMIMTILSVLAALVAFNYYEPAAQAMLEKFHDTNPMYLQPGCLLGIFFVSLLAARLAFDWLISSNVGFDAWVNRIGGGVFGIFSGMVVVGVLTVSLQMLPWDAAAMGFKPFDDSLRRQNSLLPFNPDRFVLGMVDTLSGGSLGEGARFGKTHRDFLLDLQAQRNRCDLPGRNETKPDTLTVSAVCQPQAAVPWLDEVPAYPLQDPGDPLGVPYVVRAAITQDAKDSDNWFRLPATQFRLVTDQGKSYYPLGFLTYIQKVSTGEKYNWKVLFERKNDLAQIGVVVVERIAPNKGAPLIVDWVFRVPSSEKPKTLIFRRDAKAKLPAPQSDWPDTFSDSALKRRF